MELNYIAGVSNADLLETARKFGETFDRPSVAAVSPTDLNCDRRLRVGYVSGDLRYHPVGYFLARVLSAHDRRSVEVFCYSNSAVVDAMTARLRAVSDQWRSIVGMSDADAASLIRRDGVDILIDLSGHTNRNRLPLFASRPAPVQASWLGYYGTTGLAAMDYVLMDAVSAPPGEERWYSEAVVRLPHGRFCYDPPETAPAPADPPFSRRGHVTFGCFNNISKIGPDVVRSWARILEVSPGARLICKWRTLGDENSRRRLIEAFAAAGVSADRLEPRGFSPHQEMLAEYGDIDIALDPFPFGGGLTSCEALWMGAPVVTLPETARRRVRRSAFCDMLGWMIWRRRRRRTMWRRRRPWLAILNASPRCVTPCDLAWRPRHCATARCSPRLWNQRFAKCGGAFVWGDPPPHLI